MQGSTTFNKYLFAGSAVWLVMGWIISSDTIAQDAVAPVTPGTDKVSEELFNEVIGNKIILPDNNEDAEVTEATNGEGQENAEGNMVTPVSSYRQTLPRRFSLMFRPENLETLYMALEGSYTPGTSVLADGSTVEIQNNAPNFSLGSIVYFAPESWSVWVNNKRFRHNDRINGDIRILRAEENFVDVAWQSPNLDLAIPGWEKSLESYGKVRRVKPVPVAQPVTQPGENGQPQAVSNPPGRAVATAATKAKAFQNGTFRWDYRSEDGKVFVDSYYEVVKFRLRLHQTFVTRDMAYVEGKVPTAPVQVASPTTVGVQGGVENFAGELPSDAATAALVAEGRNGDTVVTDDLTDTDTEELNSLVEDIFDESELTQE